MAWPILSFTLLCSLIIEVPRHFPQHNKAENGAKALLRMGRDVQEEEESTPWAEQQNWEAEQLKKASMRTGAKDKKRKEYDLVFEDQIDFIMDRVAEGENLEVAPPPSPAHHPSSVSCLRKAFN